MESFRIAAQSVSRIGLGTWAIGGLEWGAVSESDAVSTILAALDCGINLIDTAPIYGHGRAEQLLGKAIRRHGKRDDFFLATKAGLAWQIPGRPGVFADSSTARLRQELDDSLRRLGTDCIDLYQLHWPDPLIPIEETAALLAGFVASGKVRFLGVSNCTVSQMERFRAVAPLVSNQPPYNLFERQIDAEILPWCAENHVAVLTWRSLCRSLLGGRLATDTEFPPGDIRRVDPKFQPPRFASYIRAVQRLGNFAQANYGKSVVELAVRWVLDRPGISAALWGAKRPAQLDPVAGVMGWRLDSSAMLAIDQIVAQAVSDPVGPEYLTPSARQ